MGRRTLFTVLSLILSMLALPASVYGMHIMEGFLPPLWSVSWGVVVLPFIIWGILSLSKTIGESPKLKLLIAMAGAFAFLLSAIKIPSVTGSSSHLTGTGLGAILFGPAIMAVLGLIVLLFQAILLGHGGLTTLGANVFSMAVVGPIVAYVIFIGWKSINQSKWIGIFLAAALGNLATYVMTSIQLSLAFPADSGGFMVSLGKFLSVFALTQVPLALSEGILTVLILRSIASYYQGEFPVYKKGLKGWL